MENKAGASLCVGVWLFTLKDVYVEQTTHYQSYPRSSNYHVSPIKNYKQRKYNEIVNVQPPVMFFLILFFALGVMSRGNVGIQKINKTDE